MYSLKYSVGFYFIFQLKTINSYALNAIHLLTCQGLFSPTYGMRFFYSTQFSSVPSIIVSSILLFSLQLDSSQVCTFI